MKLMKVTGMNKAREIIEKEFEPLEHEQVTLEEAGGRYLAEDITSKEDIPGFNRSTVDGYAVKAEESFGANDSIPAIFDFCGEILMGQPASSLPSGHCCLVHTGGMLPREANAVIMVENTEKIGSQVHAFNQVAPGENIIQKGEDLRINSIVLQKGKKIRAPELGLLASIGITKINVYRKPKIGIFSSGDELVEYSKKELKNGQIRNCNSVSLVYMATQYGAIPIYGGILPDQEELFLEKSKKMLDEVDMLVFSGGSSVGDRDYTAITMKELGKPGLLIEGLSIQPGKPTLLARCGQKPLLGLPGHPISAMNIFSILGKGLINKLSGNLSMPYKATLKAILTRNIPSKSGRTDYIRVKIHEDDAQLSAAPIFGRSGILRTLSEADGLLIIPSEKEGLYEGESVEIHLWN